MLEMNFYSVNVMLIPIFVIACNLGWLALWCSVMSTAQFHSINPVLGFCAGSNPASLRVTYLQW